MKYIFAILISIISVLIIWINIKLHSENFTNPEKKADIILQMNFLESELKDNNAAEKMQQIFPEGFVFINALYGLSWCELVLSDSAIGKNIKEKAVNEALFAYNEINSEKSKWNFDKELNPDYGIFYCGWKNYLLSKLLSIDSTFPGHEKIIVEFKSQSDSIIKVLRNSESPYLESYPAQSWPADMFVAMASIRNYDKIFKPKYEKDLKNWLKKVRDRLDPITMMVPHQVNSKTGKSFCGSRGSSMSLILRMLAEIDPDFAQKQFELFSKSFISSTLGLPSISEYPKETYGIGDIDSGPVILGVGFAATINSIGTMSYYNTKGLKDNLYKTVQAFGFAYKNENQKKYLCGKLPIADAFIAWGRATNYNDSKYLKNKSESWRIKFHIISLFIILLIWMTFYGKSLIKRIKFQKK